MRTLHFEGSHGSFTACAVSGHIIHADACDCGDCDQYGGYQSIALVDVPGCDPWVLAHGGGDILDAALIYRDGGYVPAMTAHCEEGYREDIAGLLPAPSLSQLRRARIQHNALVAFENGRASRARVLNSLTQRLGFSAARANAIIDGDDKGACAPTERTYP